MSTGTGAATAIPPPRGRPPTDPRVLRDRRNRRIRLRVYGLVYLVVLALLLALAVAAYQGRFDDSVRVSLRAATLGDQLDEHADVELRGVVVGQVDTIRPDGTGADIDLSLKPGYASRIPADVRARLLPKTLFGQKYVDLVASAGPSAGGGGTAPADARFRPIRNGAVIPQDRTAAGLEIQRLMDDLEPLLTAVQPAQLDTALSAIADSLEGQGPRIGASIDELDRLLGRTNPQLPVLRDDLTQLARTTDAYSAAAPQLLDTLRNTTVTAGTLVAERQRYTRLLTAATGTAGTARSVLQENAQRFVGLVQSARPTLDLFARYSPTFPCVLDKLAEERPRLEKVFRDHELHVTIVLATPSDRYHTDELPKNGVDAAPSCAGLPNPPKPYPVPDISGDGTKGTGKLVTLPPAAVKLLKGLGVLDALGRVTGAAAERSAVDRLAAPIMDTAPDRVPSAATLLLGPMVRGTEVTLQ
jgi:virulence factor Mce-like protein